MPAPADLDDVLRRAVSLDHDFRAYRHVLGDPALVDGFLVFVEGNRIAVSSLAIPGVAQEGAPQAARAAVARFEAEEVLHLGPASLAPALRPLGFQTEFAKPPEPEFVELAADPRAMLEGRLGRKARSVARRFAITEGTGFSREHGAVVEAFAGARPVARQDRALWERIPDLVATEGMVLLEARARGDLAGFAVVDTAFARADLYVLGFFAEGAAGASDALHHEMARRAAAAGKERLNLGYALSDGLLAYKRKWGGGPVSSPPWVEHFVKEGREATFRTWEVATAAASPA